MPTAIKEVDATFYDALPPQMTDLRYLPPMQSDTKEIGRSGIGVDEVADPAYPIETIEHDTDEGYKRWNEMKKKKTDEVASYELVRNRYWEQIKSFDYYPDDQKENWTYFTGSTESHSKEFTAGIELELGLKKGMFSGALKSKFSFTQKDQSTFSQSVEHKVEKTFKAECYYLHWQTLESFDLFRTTKAKPDIPEFVKSCIGYTETYMVNKYKKSDLIESGGPSMPPLTAGAKVLKKGESTTVGTRLIGKTKFSFKNLSDQEKGEISLTPVIGGLWRNPWVIAVNPGYTKSVRNSYTGDGVQITNSGAHNMEVWTG